MQPPSNDPQLQGLEDQQAFQQSARKGLRKLIILLVLGIALYSLTHFTPIGSLLNIQEISLLDDEGALELAGLFVLSTALLMLLGAPRLPFYVLGGFIFGFFQGLALALIGSLIGSFAMFRAVRWGGRLWVRKRFANKAILQPILQTQPSVIAVATTRILPISNALINIGFAMSKVRSKVFLLGSLIGFLPHGIIAVLIGAGAADDVPWEGASQLVVAGVGLTVFFWIVSRWHNRKK